MKELRIFFAFAAILATPAQANNFTGNFSAGVEYNYWRPLDFSALDVNTQGYQVGYIDLDATHTGYGQSFLPSIPKFRYETNFGGQHQEEILTLREEGGKLEKYENLIGILDFGKVAVKYNREAFVSNVTAINNFNYIQRDGSTRQFTTGQTANFSTLFESLWAGLDFHSNYVGVFYSTYTKPYFFTDDNFQDRSTMFYSEFSSWGLEIFSERGAMVDSAVSIPYGLKIGWGDIDLGEAGSVRDTLNGEERVAFFEFAASPNWSKEIGDSISVAVGLEASYKYFYKSNGSGETIRLGEDRGYNSDFLAKFLASFVYHF